MVVLLIGMAVTAIWMAAALPSWHQQAIREKEAELVFRGEQYAAAILRYQRKNGTYPPSIDLLVSQKYLRKKYKDPMTGGDFTPVMTVLPGGRGTGIISVRSTSTDPSIMVYANQTSYSQFPYETVVNQKFATMGGGPVQPGGGVGGVRGGIPGPGLGTNPGTGTGTGQGGPGGTFGNGPTQTGGPGQVRPPGGVTGPSGPGFPSPGGRGGR